MFLIFCFLCLCCELYSDCKNKNLDIYIDKICKFWNIIFEIIIVIDNYRVRINFYGIVWGWKYFNFILNCYVFIVGKLEVEYFCVNLFCWVWGEIL